MHGFKDSFQIDHSYVSTILFVYVLNEDEAGSCLIFLLQRQEASVLLFLRI